MLDELALLSMQQGDEYLHPDDWLYWSMEMNNFKVKMRFTTSGQFSVKEQDSQIWFFVRIHK